MNVYKLILLLVFSLFLLALLLPADSRSLRRSASRRYRAYRTGTGGRGYRRFRRRRRFRGFSRRRRTRHRHRHRHNLFPSYYPYYYGGNPYPTDPYDYGSFYGARQPAVNFPDVNINVNVDADDDECTDQDDDGICDIID